MKIYIELMARLVFELGMFAIHGWWSGCDRLAQISPTNSKSFSPNCLKRVTGLIVL